jgi:lipopolysaccharide export system protein LptA
MVSGLRRARTVLGLVLVAGLAYVILLLVRVDRPSVVGVGVREGGAEAPPVPPANDPRAETGCAEPSVLDWPGGPFRRLEARRACLQPDGGSAVEGATLYLDQEEAEALVVKADRGHLPQAEADPVRLSGNVHVEAEGGFTLVAEEVELHRPDHRLTCRVPVELRMGEAVGRAGGLDHDWKTRQTWLSVAPTITIRGPRTEGREVRVTGARIGLDEDRHHVSVEGSGRIDFAAGHIAGEALSILLDAAGSDVRVIEATGAPRTVTTAALPGEGRGPGTGAVRTLRATRIVHRFAPGTRLQEIEAEGEAVLTGTVAARSEHLAGDWILLAFQPSALLRLSRVQAKGGASGPAVLRLQEPLRERIASAGQIVARLGSEGRVETLTLVSQVSVGEEADATSRTLEAERCEATFLAGGTAPESITFEGAPARLSRRRPAAGGTPIDERVVARRGTAAWGDADQPRAGMLQGDVRVTTPAGVASADEARQDPAGGRIVLTGHAHVESEGKDSHGDEVIYDEAARTVVVRGRQHTVVRDARRLGAAGALAGTAEPAYISSDQVTVEIDTRRADYTGGRPTLRRGDNEIRSDRLLLDDVAGTLEAEGTVESRLRLQESGGAPAGEEGVFDPTRLVNGRSERLHYRREGGSVVYDGSVRLEQEASRLEADRVEIHLTGHDGRLETLDALGAAFVTCPRWEAEGGEIRYHEPDDRVRIVGDRRPARARDAQGNYADGGVLEMHPRRGGIRVLAPAAGRARGSAPAPAATATPPPAGPTAPPPAVPPARGVEP